MNVQMTQTSIKGDISDTISNFSETASVQELYSGESTSTLFGKLKTAVKNLKTLLTLLGNTSIAGIGNGTVTGALSTLNNSLNNKANRTGTMSIEVEKELECDGATAYANANFIATRPANSPNLAGYGFHNRGITAGILYLSNDGMLHFLNNTRIDYTLNMTADTRAYTSSADTNISN